MEQQASKRLEELIRARARVDAERHELDAELERQKQLLTILFVDIVGSTRFYDQHGDVEGLMMVEKCLAMLTPIVEQRDGVVAKTIGDSIMAWFRNAQTAVRCGVAMQQVLAAQNAKQPPADHVHIRVALNLGLGLVKDKDVFGDVVNVASRIEKATDADEIAISPSVFEKIQHVPDLQVRQKATGVAIKGKTDTLDLYTVLWREGERPGPAPPRPSSDQLMLATGLHRGLEELARAGVPSPKGTVVLGAEEKPAAAALRFVVAQVHPDGQLGQRYAVDRPGVVLGRTRGDIQFAQDSQLAPEHARFTQLGDALYVEDVSGGAGIFRRLRAPHPLQPGEVVMLGRQKFRLQPGGATPEDLPPVAAKKTQMLGAPPVVTPAQLEQLGEGDQVIRQLPLSSPPTTFGRSRGTHTFPDDRYMSGLHASIAHGSGGYVLEDQKSTNGCYVRIRKRALLRHGDLILVGDQLLQVVAETQ